MDRERMIMWGFFIVWTLLTYLFVEWFYGRHAKIMIEYPHMRGKRPGGGYVFMLMINMMTSALSVNLARYLDMC
jgi:hypothetical protein